MNLGGLAARPITDHLALGAVAGIPLQHFAIQRVHSRTARRCFRINIKCAPVLMPVSYTHLDVYKRQSGKNPGNHRGNAKYRETDQAKREHQNADQVVTEVAPGSLEGGGKKQRWEKN